MAKVESLYGTTPAEIFESGLENVGHCGGRRNLWRVGRVTAGWSSVDPASLARMVLMLDQEQRRKTLRPLTDQI